MISSFTNCKQIGICRTTHLLVAFECIHILISYLLYKAEKPSALCCRVDISAMTAWIDIKLARSDKCACLLHSKNKCVKTACKVCYI